MNSWNVLQIVDKIIEDANVPFTVYETFSRFYRCISESEVMVWVQLYHIQNPVKVTLVSFV